MAAQQPMEIAANHPKHLPEVFEQAPTLTSSNAEWNTITLEAFCLPPGETPEFCLDNVSGKALRQLACLTGKPAREIDRGLSTVAMNYE